MGPVSGRRKGKQPNCLANCSPCGALAGLRYLLAVAGEASTGPPTMVMLEPRGLSATVYTAELDPYSEVLRAAGSDTAPILPLDPAELESENAPLGWQMRVASNLIAVG